MKSMYKFIFLAVFMFSLPLSGYPAEKASRVLSEAKSLYQQADELQGAWLSTEKLIKRAEQALKSGNEEAALKIAKKARFEAQRSLEQARDQLSNWSEPSYLK